MPLNIANFAPLNPDGTPHAASLKDADTVKPTSLIADAYRNILPFF